MYPTTFHTENMKGKCIAIGIFFSVTKNTEKRENHLKRYETIHNIKPKGIIMYYIYYMVNVVYNRVVRLVVVVVVVEIIEVMYKCGDPNFVFLFYFFLSLKRPQHSWPQGLEYVYIHIDIKL